VAVDESLVRFGMPMGPFALMDQIGLDVAAKVAGVLAKAFGVNGNGGNGSVDLLHAMAAAGLKGVKAGKGFYLYGSSGEKKGPSPELPSLIAAPKAVSGNGTHPAPSEAGTADALVDLMINEAALLLGQGAVDKPEVIDLAMIMGTGFPPFRGGLLRHADTVGREMIAQRLRARGIQPAPLLLEKGRFYP
jgi:3-hydroxyacyl-CoA dehydrogenase/enoyl-CoA hydratase/3-hydroxybutyryl-CoA epimerase